MKLPLRVLFVEDSVADTMLALHHLRESGFEPAHERVETPAAFSAALKDNLWDVIISDYNLPSFSGLEALKIFQSSHHDIPFLLISGVLGEERAVEMMRAGAHDYIVKDNLGRLGPSITRELKSAKARREHTRVQEIAAHLAAIVESSEDAILSKTLGGTIMSWNRAATQVYGYEPEEIIGRPLSLLVPPSRQHEMDEVLLKLKHREHVPRFDTIRRRKDGTEVELSVTISAITAPTGEIIGASTIARDITDRRREEQERLRLIEDLTAALTQAKTLRSLLPICAGCKKIRDDKGYWQQLEIYFQQYAHVGFSHGLCPECSLRLYPEFDPAAAKSNGTVPGPR